MKVRVIVTDGAGNKYEGEATLVAVTRARSPRTTPGRKPQPTPPVRTPDFSLPLRAFMKRHAKGLAGSRKFTVLLAKLSSGKTGAAIGRSEIEKTWNRMTGLMGGRFNPSYTTRAKDNGWVDTPKTGYYALRASWTGAFGD